MTFDMFCFIGQCYDGAAAMKGRRTGLKARVQQENAKAIYIHCYAHTLQLAVQDSSRTVKLINNTMDIASEISKLVKNSPKRDAEFRKIQAAGIDVSTVGIRTLCPTR